MADPLSITLAATTLATALKDMVEFVQAIEESFEKVSRNRRELRSLISEIKTTVFQLKKFSDDHYDVLCDAVDTKHAILGLISDMKTIYDTCRDMSPPVPPRKMGRLKLNLNAWLNNNKIDEDIKNLRNRVDKCHSQFMIFAVMRIENHLIVMKQHTNVRPKQVQEEEATIRASDESLIAFMGSNARTLSKLPPEITADFISDTYLRLQINTIDYMLNHLSSNHLSSDPFPLEDPLGRYLLPYHPFVPQVNSCDKNSIRQEMIFQSLEIQSYLRGDSQKLSIQTGASYMINLCVGLEALRMYQEAFTIITWAVNIFRILVKANSTVYPPYLVPSLRLLSNLYMRFGNMDESFSAIEEAVKISREFQSSTTSVEVEFQHGEVLKTLAFTCSLKGDKEASLKAALEAVDIYKKSVNKNHDSTSYDLPINLSNSPVASLFEGVPPHAITGYGLALRQLSFSFERNDRQDDAYKTAREALDVLIFSSNILSDSEVEYQIASMLSRVSDEQFHGFISPEEALPLSERAVAMLRRLYNKVPGEHGRNGIPLFDALWQQADILGKLGRWDEALILWRETAELGKDIMVDDQSFRHGDALNQLSWSLRKLKRHDEAASIMTETVMIYSRYEAEAPDRVAHGYFNLGVELRLANRHPEAIKALQSALTHYRALAFKDHKYTKNIGKTLNQLTKTFINCQDFYQAFNEGHESLKVHKSLIEKDSSVRNEYIFAIKLNCQVAGLADTEEKCVERARYNVLCARTLATLHPTEANLMLYHVVQKLAGVLFRFGRMSEAGIVLQEALEWHEKNPSQEENEVVEYMNCLITMSVIVSKQGHIQKAEEYIQKSIDVGKPHSSHKIISSALLGSMYRRVRILCITGLYGEAVEASQECVDFARKTEAEGIHVVEFIGCLQAAAIAFDCNGRFTEAIGYIQEALELCRRGDTIELAKTIFSVLLLEGESLMYLSEFLADAGRETEALGKGKAAVDNILGLRKDVGLPWLYVEKTYFYALATYSVRLAANGDLSDSLERLGEVRSHFEKQIDSQLGVALSLAWVLEVEGIICCAAGRLDDGAAAVAKLHDLQNRLGIVHPELAKNVEVTLERQRTSPSTIALVRKLNLKCDHEHQKSPS